MRKEPIKFVQRSGKIEVDYITTEEELLNVKIEFAKLETLYDRVVRDRNNIKLKLDNIKETVEELDTKFKIDANDYYVYYLMTWDSMYVIDRKLFNIINTIKQTFKE